MSFGQSTVADGHRFFRLPLVRRAVMIMILGLVALAGWPVAGWLARQDPETEQSRRDFMRTKLLFCQNIMEGIATSNFALIEEGAAEVRKITEAEQWLAADTAEYRHYSEDLRAIADRIAVAARAKNLDAVAFRYADMTANCMDCHEYSQAMKIW